MSGYHKLSHLVLIEGLRSDSISILIPLLDTDSMEMLIVLLTFRMDMLSPFVGQKVRKNLFALNAKTKNKINNR